MCLERGFIHKNYTLGIIWVLACEIYYLNADHKVKDILLYYNQSVVIVIDQGIMMRVNRILQNIFDSIRYKYNPKLNLTSINPKK